MNVNNKDPEESRKNFWAIMKLVTGHYYSSEHETTHYISRWMLAIMIMKKIVINYDLSWKSNRSQYFKGTGNNTIFHEECQQ